MVRLFMVSALGVLILMSGLACSSAVSMIRDPDIRTTLGKNAAYLDGDPGHMYQVAWYEYVCNAPDTNEYLSLVLLPDRNADAPAITLHFFVSGDGTETNLLEEGANRTRLLLDSVTLNYDNVHDFRGLSGVVYDFFDTDEGFELVLTTGNLVVFYSRNVEYNLFVGNIITDIYVQIPLQVRAVLYRDDLMNHCV